MILTTYYCDICGSLLFQSEQYISFNEVLNSETVNFHKRWHQELKSNIDRLFDIDKES